MDLIECIVEDVLHPVIQHGSGEDVCDVAKRIEDLHEVPGTHRLRIFSNLLLQQSYSELCQFLWPQSRCFEAWDLKARLNSVRAVRMGFMP